MKMEELLKASVDQRASDLHLLPGLAPLLRIHGSLASMKGAEKISPEDVKTLLYSVMSKEQQEEFEKNLICEMGLSIPNIGNFRVSALHQMHGVAAVFRVIPEAVPAFEDLGLPIILKSLLTLSHGLILVTGATGSGKSTTLAAMIDYINAFRACSIVTIEDPIEFTYKPKQSVFHQLEVGRDTPNFATALRGALRQDVNVVLIGELRDLETMRLALTAAETGQLVLATLHASSAELAISRFVDVFPTEEKTYVRSLLSETLQAVLCQTLVKKLAGGRVAAFEVMLVTTAMRHFIRQDMVAHMESAMQTSGDKGMCTLEHSLHELVAKQIIGLNVANTVLLHRSGFKTAIAQHKK
ncbi:MAG: PilT/PilU family type 4a pilus ATPase [Gammaproteobacteria bacterium]|nr:PilT/PilU family type 4a pilus ATPase [Gammaproteobacteria bacterium]